MRRNLTISFSEEFVRWMDDERDDSRGVFLEAVCQHDLGWEATVPSSGRSPEAKVENGPSRELPPLMTGRDVLARQQGGGITQRELEEQRQSEAGEI